MTTKLYCYHCRRWLEDEDVHIEDDYIGEAHGEPAYEPKLVCSDCGYTVGEELYEEEEAEDDENQNQDE